MRAERPPVIYILIKIIQLLYQGQKPYLLVLAEGI
nr:MAG TPA: hypothetical protein [Caudoviricetes sp.]